MEVGLRWPPEAFLRRKLEGLAAAGMAVTVASRGGPRRRRERLAGVRLVRLPAEGDSRLIIAAGLLWAGLRLLFSRPGQLLAVVRAVWRGRRSCRHGRRSRWWRTRCSVLAARPDVLHFEWESAAVRSLPLLEARVCPVVVSVRGSGVNVHPHAGQDDLAAAYPEVFARATAVHCVSEAVREEAARFGLEPAKARVIHPAVDTGYFRPPAAADSAPEGLRVVGVGRLNWVKGYDYALEAVASLARAGFPVTYEILGGEPAPDTGEASDRTRLLYLIHELGLEGRVRLLGEVAAGGGAGAAVGVGRAAAGEPLRGPAEHGARGDGLRAAGGGDRLRRAARGGRPWRRGPGLPAPLAAGPGGRAGFPARPGPRAAHG